MRNSRGGLGGIPFPGISGAPPAFARSRQAKAPGEVFGLKSRPSRRKVIAVYRTLPWCDLTPNSWTSDIAAVALCPYGLGQPTMFRGRLVPVGGGNGGHVEMAETLISTRLLEVISKRAAGNGKSPGEPSLPDLQSHFRGHAGLASTGWTLRGLAGLRPASDERSDFPDP